MVITRSVIIGCQQCGTKNRVPQARVLERPICGKCRAPLSPRSSPGGSVIVTDHTFRDEVINFSGVVLVDCWAAWCGPCRIVGPMLDQLAVEYAGRAKISKLNVDENPSTASQFGIRSIPTLLFFKNGKLEKQLVGALPKGQIESQLKVLL